MENSSKTKKGCKKLIQLLCGRELNAFNRKELIKKGKLNSYN